jgi:hypothetical protein
MTGDAWAQFEHDPRRPENGTLRASDRDRDVVNQMLGTAYAEGRLTPAEFDERSDQVLICKTLAELPPIVVDLVAPSLPGTATGGGHFQAEAEQRYRQQRRESLWAFLTPTLICVVVWLATMGPMSFPWPAFVAIGTGMRWARLATSREDSTEAIRRSLERKERRRLEHEARRRGELGGSEGARTDHDGTEDQD